MAAECIIRKLRRTKNLNVCSDFETIAFQVINSVLYHIGIVMKNFESSQLSNSIDQENDSNDKNIY